MIVVSAELYRVALPLVHSFQTSSHRKNHLEHILVKLTDDGGNSGWGEIASASHPFFSAETTDTCWQIAATEILPTLVGRSWETPADAVQLWKRVRGNNFAKSGVEMAVWDLFSRRQDASLASVLGGVRETVVAGVSLGIEPTIEKLLTEVGHQLDAGYKRVKLKIAPGWDVAPVAAVRERFGDIILHVDANAVYTESAEDLAALSALDHFDLSMIEQPFAMENLLAHARLQAQINTPICLDESIESLAQLQTALSLDACRVLNIKVSRMGGLSESVAAHNLCFAAGIPVWCGGMHEFGIGRAANLALSSLPGFTLPSDVSASEKYYRKDITTRPITAVDGVVEVPTGPGLGFDVDLDFLAANTVDRLSIDAPLGNSGS